MRARAKLLDNTLIWTTIAMIRVHPKLFSGFPVEAYALYFAQQTDEKQTNMNKSHDLPYTYSAMNNTVKREYNGWCFNDTMVG